LDGNALHFPKSPSALSIKQHFFLLAKYPKCTHNGGGSGSNTACMMAKRKKWKKLMMDKSFFLSVRPFVRPCSIMPFLLDPRKVLDGKKWRDDEGEDIQWKHRATVEKCPKNTRISSRVAGEIMKKAATSPSRPNITYPHRR